MYTVVIADDEPIERKYLRTVFQEHPDRYLVVGEASNGEAAVRASLASRPDVVIMDISMPVCSGLLAAKRIKAEIANTVIILNSAYAEFEFARQAIDNNLDAYLLKPSSNQKILDTVEACLNKKRVPSLLGEHVDDRSGNVAGSPIYPEIAGLLNSVYTGVPAIVEQSMRSYLSFLKSQHKVLQTHRLEIINTIFSLERALVGSGIPPDLVGLLDTNRYLQQIGHSTHWHEILSCADDCLRHMLVLVSTNSVRAKDPSSLVEEYINSNFHKDINLESLAAMFHFNPAYLSRAFCQSRGMTMRAYLNKRRVEHAKGLLRRSSLQVSEVARNCGFRSVPHFNQVFRKITNTTPSQYRKSERGMTASAY